MNALANVDLLRFSRVSAARRLVPLALGLVIVTGFALGAARAEPPPTTVARQPMVCDGLAAGARFEAWLEFDKSFDPTEPGYSIPAGATIRIAFPTAFSPRPSLSTEAVMIKWEQGAIPASFTVASDNGDARTIVIRFAEALSPDAQGYPGLKAIHLRTNLINPAQAGDYPIRLQFADAGPLTGETTAIAHIAAVPEPNVAPYNQLHSGKDEDWLRVKAGADADLPFDFLVTLPDAARAAIILKPSPDGGLAIMSDGRAVGAIVTHGVPIVLTPVPFGPGFSRLGIVEVRAKAGPTPGVAEIAASLVGGASSGVRVIVEEK
ncbi:MAG: hypothetical protein ACLPN5_21675 [Roseiarcus sp.]